MDLTVILELLIIVVVVIDISVHLYQLPQADRIKALEVALEDLKWVVSNLSVKPGDTQPMIPPKIVKPLTKP